MFFLILIWSYCENKLPLCNNITKWYKYEKESLFTDHFFSSIDRLRTKRDCYLLWKRYALRCWWIYSHCCITRSGIQVYNKRLVTWTVGVYMRHVKTAVVILLATAGKQYPVPIAAPCMITLGKGEIRIFKRPIRPIFKIQQIQVGVLVPDVE